MPKSIQQRGLGQSSDSFRYDFLGSPVFPHVTIHNVQGGGDLDIVVHNATAENVYVQKVMVNANPASSPFILVSDLTVVDGSKLEFWMGPSPNNNSLLFNAA